MTIQTARKILDEVRQGQGKNYPLSTINLALILTGDYARLSRRLSHDYDLPLCLN